MKITMQSFSNPTTYYQVDTQNYTCSCPAYTTSKGCKHLAAVGQYPCKSHKLSERPSFSQALSGLVKGIRVRNVEEAAYWLQYCWGFKEKLAGAQFRTVRRLLIGSAEDGHSIAVMEKVSENFRALLEKDVEFPYVLAELIRVCKIPNWWDPRTGGHGYIRTGMLAQRRTLYEPASDDINQCLNRLDSAVDQQDAVSALYWVFRINAMGEGAWLTLVHWLQAAAGARHQTYALRLMQNICIPHSNIRRSGKTTNFLGGDENFICQAAWFLAGGKSPVVDAIEPVTKSEVRELLEKVQATPAHVIPGWCCDGIHCGGSDVRYAGLWERMYAVCKSFDCYQRVSPDDPWLEDLFYSLEGLIAC